MKKDTITINLIVFGIIALVIGILYIFAGIYLWDVYLEEWGIVMTVEGAIFELISFGLFTKHILPNKKGSFFYGLLLAIIGVIIAICIKNRENNTYKTNKYEDLEKLQKLKEQGTITNEEFENEKSKILNGGKYESK